MWCSGPSSLPWAWITGKHSSIPSWLEPAPAAITVQLDRPGAPRVARALALLIDEINATRPPCPATPGPLPTSRPNQRRLSFPAGILSYLSPQGF